MSLDIRLARLYKTLDNERKYKGYTLTEIIVALVFFFFGIVFDVIVTGVIGSFVSVFFLRYLKDLLKNDREKEESFFICLIFLHTRKKVSKTF